MKASDLFLRCLEAQGVDTIYGVPGEENADIMISLLDSKIKFMITNHEQSAAFMADMHGRLTGKPGICLATLGPGATNLITGVANANMDHVPLIAIVGQADTTRLHKESHQNMDSVAMYQPVTKWTTTIRDAAVIPEVIQKAFKVAMEGRPGAVMIELPEDIAKHEVDLDPITPMNERCEFGASSHDVNGIIKLIENSKMPILLVGAGATRGHCDLPLKSFMDKTGIYGATTFMGKGCIDSRHPQSLFCVGLGVRDIASEAFDLADLVICIGYGMVEWHPDRWNNGHQKRVVHINDYPAEVDKNYIPELELIGNVNSILEAINAKIKQQKPKNSERFAKIRERIETEIHEHDADTHFPVKPQRNISDLRKSLHSDDILISDVGAHKMWIARQYATHRSKTCLIYNGFCSMGGAIPGAIEAKRLNPDKTVVAVCGDGGFMMSIQSLMIAVRYHIHVIIVVWEDNFYGLIKWKQEATYNKVAHVDLQNPDLVAVAKGFGCEATRIENSNDFSAAFETAKKRTSLPSVIVVPIDYSENMLLNKRLGEIVAR